MKYITIIATTLAITLSGCDESPQQSTNPPPVSTEQSATTPMPSPQEETMQMSSTPAHSGDPRSEMLALATQSGCLGCHEIDKKKVGPAWQAVSQRYSGDESARSMLIEKVKKGGSGNWTEVTGGVPMPPNSPRVKDDDIARLVDFILSL